MPIRAFVLCGLACVLASCAGVPGSGDPGYAHDLDGTYAGTLAIGDAEYEAVVRMETLAGGELTGALGAAAVRAGDDGRSTNLEGDFSGAVFGTTVVWRSSWVSPTGCSGLLRGRGSVLREGAVAEGEIRLESSCAPGSSGTFRLARQDEGADASSSATPGDTSPGATLP